MRQKLNLITFGVADFARAVAFYEGLGWKKSDKSLDGLTLFPLGGMTLALHRRHELEDDVTLAYQPSRFYGMTLSFNAKSEQEVDEVMSEAQKLGGEIVKPAQKVFWGGYSGYFKDLDGFLIEVAHNPFWPLDDNDNLAL
jgi:predicted lactoylglutathione lyase